MCFPCRHSAEHKKHEKVARELEAARGEFREFERKDIKVLPKLMGSSLTLLFHNRPCPASSPSALCFIGSCHCET